MIGRGIWRHADIPRMVALWLAILIFTSQLAGNLRVADERYSPQVGLHYGGVVFGFYKTAIRKMKNRESNREEKIAVFVNRGES